MAENLQKTVTNTKNYLWRNVGAYPLVSFSFMLRVEGMWDLPCKQIHNMSRENEFDYIQEGGLNDYVHARRKPISKPFTFQVERYVGVDLAVASDPLALGTELVLPLLLFVNKYAVWDAGDMKPVRTYAFTGCTVIGKDYGTLDAERSGLLVETTTIAYREMACVDIYSDLDGMTLDTWGFNGNEKEGTGPRRYNQATSNTEELTKAEMEERAQLYPKKPSVKKPENKVPKARLWSIGGEKNQSPDQPMNSNQGNIEKNKVKKAEFEKNAKLYPQEASVKKPENEVPKARLWPKKKSAQTITQYLNDYKK